MFGDNGLAVDLEAVDDLIHDIEVLVIGFDFTSDRLLLDLRVDGDGYTPPLIEMVEPLGNAEERADWLDARRPGVLPPERSYFFIWPHTIQYLRASPLFDGVACRIEREHSLDMRAELSSIARELHCRERRNIVGAIHGSEGFQTLWSRAE